MKTARLIAALTAGAALGLAAPAAAQTSGSQEMPETAPLPLEVTTAPLSAGEGRPAGPRLSPEARAVLDQLRKAYIGLENMEVTGTLSTDFEVAGRVEKTEKAFFGAYQAPGRFRHVVENEFVAGSTGEKSYVYNVKSNQYLLAPVPPGEALQRSLPGNLVGLLQSQNPSLLLAISQEPLQALASDARTVELIEDERVDGKQYSALRLQMPQGRGVTVVLVDKETSLLRRVTIDMKPGLERAGVAGVKSATYVIDYTRTRPVAEFPEGYFAWAPPAGATEIPSPSENGTTAPLSPIPPAAAP